MKNPLQELISQRPIVGFESPANFPVTVYAETPTPLAAFDPTKPTIDQTRQAAIDSIRNNFQNLPIPPASPPGGATKNIQINYNGAFYGDANFNYDPAVGSASLAYDFTVGRYLIANARATLYGGVAMANNVAASNVDLSQHIAMYSNSFGFNVTSGTLNVVSAGYAHGFTSGGFYTGNVNCAAINATGSLTVSGITASGGINGNGGISCNGITSLGCLGTIAAGPQGSQPQAQATAGANAAYMAFHRPGNYAALFGIDTDNQWKVGGWSMGAISYRILHEANSWSIDSSSNLWFTNPVANTASYIYVNVNGAGGQVPGLGYKTGGVTRFDIVGLNDSSELRIRTFDDSANLRQNMMRFQRSAGGYVLVTAPFTPAVDNGYPCGFSGLRWTAVWAVAGAINTSDARLKKNVKDSDLGLAFVESLHPVSYQWIVGQNKVIDHDKDGNPITVPIPGVRTHYGLIAQEVKQVLGAKDFGGYIQSDMKDPESELGLNYSEFIAPLIKAVQELSARVKALEALNG